VNEINVFSLKHSGGGDQMSSNIEEFSLFSSLGVTELAPWLSDDKKETNNHTTYKDLRTDEKLSILPEITQQKDDLIYQNSQFEEKIRNLEEMIKRMDSKVKKLESKQKEIYNIHKSKSENSLLSTINFEKKTDVKIDPIKVNLKDKNGTLNIERFRTLEGRQAFQQSKFSSLDNVFGGSSASLWTKGEICSK
jgi:hypothetical protein